MLGDVHSLLSARLHTDESGSARRLDVTDAGFYFSATTFIDYAIFDDCYLLQHASRSLRLVLIQAHPVQQNFSGRMDFAKFEEREIWAQKQQRDLGQCPRLPDSDVGPWSSGWTAANGEDRGLRRLSLCARAQ